MKRLFLFLLALCIIVSICGCNTEVKPPIEPSTDPSTVPTQDSPANNTQPSTPDTTEPAAQQLPMHSISMPVYTQSTFSEDGSLVFSETYQGVSMVLPDPDVAHHVIVDILNVIDSCNSSATSVRDAALSDYSSASEWMPYSCQTILDPIRIDDSVLSLFGISRVYNGSSHPTHTAVSANYDLIHGEKLTLPTLLTDVSAAEDLRDLMINAFSETDNSHLLYTDFSDTINNVLTNGLNTFENWYLSGTGLVFFFSPYEIAPYSAGVVSAEIPYSNLVGIINDAFFPVERINSGELVAESFENYNTDRFNQSCEIIQNAGSQRIILHCGDGAVNNLKINQGFWDAEGKQFTSNATILACATVTPGDAVIIECDIPDVMSNLQVTYTSDGSEHTKYITQSGKDGSIILLGE